MIAVGFDPERAANILLRLPQLGPQTNGPYPTSEERLRAVRLARGSALSPQGAAGAVEGAL